MSRTAMTRYHRAFAVVVTVLAALAKPADSAAQIPPGARYRVVGSDHFDVTFGPGLEPLARRVLEVAERSRDLLIRNLSEPPEGRIDILLIDAVDFSNGFASPFPSNRIVLYARPPVDDEALAYSTDWIDLVVSHEVTHSFHMDRAGLIGRLLRSVFGRMPLIFPMFPAVGTPSWSIEGLAVAVESEYTGQGRALGSEHEMIVRTAVLAGRSDRMDRLNESSPIWPGGQRAYIYGSLFMEYLKERHGEDVFERILDRTSSAVVPPFLFFDNVAHRAFDETFDEAYDAWQASLTLRYGVLADSLTAAGLTDSEPVTEPARYAQYPRVSPDGRSLVFTAEDGRSSAAARVVDLGAGSIERSIRRNGRDLQTWLPDGRLLLSQFEFDGPYSILSDLWIEGDGGGRLTEGARLQAPDARADGSVVAVANGGGVAELVRVDPTDGRVHPITDDGASALWSYPRWSPDGTRIAASRWTRDGSHAIVVLDTMGSVLTTVIDGPWLNLAPAWSADGRWILFSSDRTGITNLYAADLQSGGAPELRQVTNVLTGAFQPEVSPDNRTIFFAKYYDSGYAIERMPFDPSSWRMPAPIALLANAERSTNGRVQAVRTGPPASADDGAAVTQMPARSYSAWRTLAPTFWAPVLTGTDEAGTFIGASIRGQDLIGRHSFRATASTDVEGSGRWEGEFRYSNASLGNPVLSVNARRRWSDLGRIQLTDSTTGLRIERDDAISAFATFSLRRWRTSASFSAGIERQWYRQQLFADPRFRLRDPDDTQTNLIGSFSIATTQYPAYAISREDGFTFAILAERSLEDESTAFRDSTGIHTESYTEWRAASSLYKSIDLGGFSHNVFALHGAGYLSTGDGAALHRIGGATGSYAQLLGFGVTGGSKLLPVRGFTDGVIAGTRAWVATAEWRVPLALVGRRPSLSPVFIDRISAAAFLDAGDAWCSRDEREISQYCNNLELLETPLLGAGAELAVDIGFAGIFTGRLRGGFGVPLRGPQDRTRFYLLIGSNF